MKYFKVVSDGVNLREGPSTDFPIIEKLQKGRVIRQPEGWTYALVIDEDGVISTGFAKSEFLAETTEPPKPTPPPETLVSGQQFLDLAATKVGQEYVFGASAPFENPDYNGPWDCAEFISWVVYQITKKVYGCVNNKAPLKDVDAYTGGWAADVKAGRVLSTTLDKAFKTAGAILLRYYGKSGHIVFSDGEGGTIEAMNEANGVKRSVVSGRDWSNAILIPGVKYS